MTVLVLAGTSEARRLAAALAGRGIAAIASLAGAVRQPGPLAVPTRVGGFGGAGPFAAYLKEAGIRAVVDATHPFAAAITPRTVAVCRDLAIPCLRLERPPWVPGPGDHWTEIGEEAEALRHIRPGQTVFLATGRQTLDRFSGLADMQVYCRQIDPPDTPFPFARGGFVIGRPPFPVAEEEALFRRLGVDWLVVKNAGGAESRTKLDAACALGLPVLMLRRPEPPACDRVETVEAALDWVLSQGATA
jgi:precorrin-6A/cobalt-precorrin-6A reductase